MRAREIYNRNIKGAALPHQRPDETGNQGAAAGESVGDLQKQIDDQETGQDEVVPAIARKGPVQSLRKP